jgi:hypothetical protein
MMFWKKGFGVLAMLIAALMVIVSPAGEAQPIDTTTTSKPRPVVFQSPDSMLTETNETPPPVETTHRNAWGIDILVSNDGFGLGTFYRREFNQDLYGFVSFSISEAKDDREVEFIDFFGNAFIPGKLNRFLVMPLIVGVQRRMFREEILDTFRPYVNAGIGPTMIFVSPYTEITEVPSGLIFEQVEFFESLGKGQPHYTLGGYVGFGANFGGDQSNLFGVNFRYYLTYLFGDGIPSLYNSETGKPAQNKTSFGGFFITINVGMVY